MEPDEQRDTGSGASRRGLMRYAGMGVELAASIIGLTLVGLWVDHRFQTSPVGVLIGAGLGVVGGMYNFIREALRLSAKQNALEHRDKNTTGDDDDRHR